MSSQDNAEFAKRLKRIEKSQKKFARAKHNPKEHGSMPMFKSSSEKKKGTSLSTWVVRFMLFYVMFVGVKSFLAFEMGPEAYNERIAEMAEGETAAKTMAFVMGSGPLMNFLTKTFADISVPAVDETLPLADGTPAVADGAEPVTGATENESATQEGSAQ
jgi:hypothetical protein